MRESSFSFLSWLWKRCNSGPLLPRRVLLAIHWPDLDLVMSGQALSAWTGSTPKGSRLFRAAVLCRGVVDQKHRDQERRDELEFIENGPHYIGFDRDAAIEEFKRKWVR